MRAFIDATFRANPSYDLVLLECLSSVERECVGDMQEHEALYGYLRPHRGSGLEWRSASSDTALLLLTLREPGPIPAYVRTSLRGETDVVARLVLDGVLEIEHNGAFCSGPAAVALVLEPTRKHEPGAIAKLSVAALQYAQTLEGLSADELAMRLYFYGRRPVSPSWQSRLPSEEAVKEFLGLGREGPVQASLDASWIEGRPRDQRFWRMWRPRGDKAESDTAGYKLYVSPACASLPDTLLATIETLSGVPGVQGFKVGRDVYGLCRPDKLVAYFSRLEALQVAAAQLRARLQGTPPHGVPFTAEVTRDGLLSWGIDPPPGQQLANARARGSWRLWVADRLAEYLLAAKARSDGTACWRFALDRLRVDGLDTDTWVPVSGLWGQQMATG